MNLHELEYKARALRTHNEALVGVMPTRVRIHPETSREVVRDTPDMDFLMWMENRDLPTVAGMMLEEDPNIPPGTIVVD